MLFDHITRPEFQCRFQWQAGSVAFWDNRCVQHYALWDYYPNRRRGLRVTIKGDVPY
jgi:taurine dioxygenase